MTKRSNLLGGIALLTAPFAAQAQAPAAPQDILPPPPDSHSPKALNRVLLERNVTPRAVA